MECKRLGCIPCNRTKPGGAGECPDSTSDAPADYRPVETYPAVIFDAYAVYQAMSEKAKKCIAPGDVADVLDAVADLIRQDLKKR